jgi:trimethylamine---corrinoid protein Co-methyltransferase
MEAHLKTARFEVLSADEVERIHAASMGVLETTGIKVDFPFARELFRSAGAQVDEAAQCVRLPEKVVMDAISHAPEAFWLNGRAGDFRMQVGGGATQFAGLGTPTHIIEGNPPVYRDTNLNDLKRHIQLISACTNIHGCQMDIWPNDLLMTRIHTEAILTWVLHSRKSFGLGCYGYRPTLDMMEMMALAVRGRQELRHNPRFLGICSVMSPLQMAQIQVEGLLICAAYGQPVAVSPEAIAGATAPVTLAGLLVQENANILAHIALGQIYRPGSPVLYGTVSTIANMRHGTVALGSVETGLITAASAQMARHYRLPCRSVGGATDSKLVDVQAGMERSLTLMPAVLAGVDYITCGGTLDSTMLESEALLLLDDELCGNLKRMERGIEVNDESMALDLIQRIGFSGNYLAEEHTVRHFRQEHFLPKLAVRDPFEAWQSSGARSALDLAQEKVESLLAGQEAAVLDAGLEKDLLDYCQSVSQRPVEEFYGYEDPSRQDWEHL